MDDEILDLSAGSEDGDATMAVVDVITDILMDMADAADLPASDMEEVRLQMAEVASIILAELDFQVVDVASNGVITATLNPQGFGI